VVVVMMMMMIIFMMMIIIIIIVTMVKKGEYLSRIKSNQSPASRRQCLGQNQSLGKNLR
jgi:hypothetical protein